MPMLCTSCEHVDNSTEALCPKCGAAMRMSLLAGLKFEDDDSDTIKIKDGETPSLGMRIQQVLMGIVATNVTAVGLAFIALLVIALSPLTPETLAADHPFFFHLMAGGIMLAAPLLVVAIQLRDVYMAQFIAAIIGAAGTLIIAFTRLYVGIPITWYEWLIIPVATGLSFLVGLKIAGKPAVVEVFEFKPINSWDKKSKPTEKEIAPVSAKPLNQLILGVAVGLICWNGLGALLAMLLKPLLRNPALLQTSMSRVEYPLQIVACFAAGMVAGASTTAGFFQGFFAAIMLVVMRQLINPSESPEELIIEMTLIIIATSVGGLYGRRIFRPFRIYGNARIAQQARKPVKQEVGATT